MTETRFIQNDASGEAGASSRLIASCFALSAFCVATVAGLASGNAASAVLGRAIIAMIACYPAGLIIGMVAQRIVAEHAARAHDASTQDANDETAPDAQDPPVSEPATADDEEVLVV